MFLLPLDRYMWWKIHLCLSPFAYKAKFLECWGAQVNYSHLGNLKTTLMPGSHSQTDIIISLVWGCSLTLEFFKAPQVILMGSQVWEPLHRKTFSPLLRTLFLNTQITVKSFYCKYHFSEIRGRKCHLMSRPSWSGIFLVHLRRFIEKLVFNISIRPDV